MPKRTSKRASYWDGVAWIANNDNPGMNEEPPELAGYVSVLMLADLFGADPEQVALDVFEKRVDDERIAQ